MLAGDPDEAVVEGAEPVVVVLLAGVTCTAFGSAPNVATVDDAASESSLSKLARASRDAGVLVFPAADGSVPDESML
jgi:hypothetical protein